MENLKIFKLYIHESNNDILKNLCDIQILGSITYGNTFIPFFEEKKSFDYV